MQLWKWNLLIHYWQLQTFPLTLGRVHFSCRFVWSRRNVCRLKVKETFSRQRQFVENSKTVEVGINVVKKKNRLVIH